VGALAVGGVSPADLDAVTLDAYGTLVTLADPVPALGKALSARGVERTPEVVLAGFRAEVAHYGPRASLGHDEESLALLQRECAGVFLDAIGADLDAHEFAPAYVGALHFEVLPGVLSALGQLRGLGLELAVVANWDLSLHRLLDETGLAHHLTTVVHAAAKPAPDGLLHALGRLGVEAGRALHIGDERADEQAAQAAGMAYAPAPVPAAVARLA
jgi:HAD superfamily hydrolase (TIGR01509 family)